MFAHKYMRFWLLLLLLTSLFVLAACGDDDNGDDDDTAETTPVATDVVSETTPEPAEAATEEAEEPAADATEMAEEPAADATEAAVEAASGEEARLLLATTTSTEDSGLLDYILPDFEEQYNATVDVVAVGTGQALELGANGDADVVLVHARAREDEFVAEGNGTQRYDVMYNDYVIVGPADDPAGIQGMTDAAAALTQIASEEALFVSRGDDSGTHTKELSIWAAAEIEPSGDWYQSAGQGMGEVLTIAAEQQGYTLSDRATYATRKAAGLELEILVEGDPVLFNPYGVIPVNPEQHPDVNAELAQAFADWITSLETQELIASFEVEGQALFTPDSEAWRAAQGEMSAEMEATTEMEAPAEADATAEAE